jgi:hypothetical protein
MSDTEIEAVAKALMGAFESSNEMVDFARAAIAALDAHRASQAHVHPGPQTVTSVEELEALPGMAACEGANGTLFRAGMYHGYPTNLAEQHGVFPATVLTPAPRATANREDLGRAVRDAWVAWAREQDNPKDSWLVGWDELDEGQREVDMRIGEALAGFLAPRATVKPDRKAVLAVLEQRKSGSPAWDYEYSENEHYEGFGAHIWTYRPERAADAIMALLTGNGGAS